MDKFVVLTVDLWVMLWGVERFGCRRDDREVGKDWLVGIDSEGMRL